MKKNSFVLFLLCVVLLAGFIAATNCPPSIPKTYSGEVYYKDGGFLETKKLLDGAIYPLRAIMGSNTVGIGEVIGGNYSINIEPCFGSTGEIIFVINGIQSDDEGNYVGQEDWGNEEELELLFIPEPPKDDTCGDNAIQLGEECDGINLGGRNPNECGTGWTGTISCSSTCQIDYSQCSVVQQTSTPPSSGSSSSGGGGSSSSGGGGGGSSTTKKTNTTTNVISLSTGNNVTNGSTSTAGNSTEEVSGNIGFFRTTGNAVSEFSKTPTGKGLIIFVSVAVFLVIVLFVSGSKNKSKKETATPVKNVKTSKGKNKEIKIVKLSELRKRK